MTFELSFGALVSRGVLALAVVLTACGAKTGLLVGEPTADGGACACDSPGVVGPWGVCESFSGTCDTDGTRSRTVTTPSCIGELCVATIRTETESCTRITRGIVCREARDLCDVEERCDGLAPACPADEVQGPGFECRGSSLPCDVAELCDGASARCPSDDVRMRGFICRPADDVCDETDVCNGVSKLCPTDLLLPASTLCRPVAGGCDVAETCNGSSSECPMDEFVPAGIVCSATSTCSGTASSCP